MPLLLILAIGAGGAWWWFRAPAPVSYATQIADQGPVTATVVATGTVNPVLTVTVGSYVSGVVQEVLCDYNTQVRKGQVCARIDPRPFQTAVEQAQADLAMAKAQLQKDTANLAYLKLSADRNARLAKENAVSQDTADNAKSLSDQADAQLAVDNATITQRQAALDSAKVNLDYTSIVSPVDGTVVTRDVTIGQTVAASFQTPTLFLIAQDLTKMEVDTNVSESDIGAVKVGETATFNVDAYPKRTFQGTVSAVRQSPQSIQNVITYDVVIAVDNPDGALLPGMTASTQIVIDHRDSVLRVLSSALRYTPSSGGRPHHFGQGANVVTGGEPGAQPGSPMAGATPRKKGPPPHVFVLRDGKPAFVRIETGLDDGTYTEVTGGALKAGDAVIVGESNPGAGPSASPQGGPRLRL